MDVSLPYNSFRDWLVREYGERVQKLCIDAGFTCPNRDGRKGTNGCVFCDSQGSGARHIKTAREVESQVRSQIAQVERRFKARKFIAYFQAFTNTYAPLDRLREIYDSAFCDDRIVGLSVGTRSDCLDESVCALLASYRERGRVWVEVGLQTANQDTLNRMNRGETVEQFRLACRAALQQGLDVVGHVILGLPGDSHSDFVRAIEVLNEAGVTGVKIHNLFVDCRAPIAAMWRRGEVPVLSRQDYVKAVCDALEILSPRILIHRLTGEAPAGELLAPDWVRNKKDVLDAIVTELNRRGTRQGSRFNGQAAVPAP